MKNIHISELLENRDPVTFLMESSIKDIMTTFVENWRIHQFYIIDNKGILKGVITKNQILDYLAPFYCTMDRTYNSQLNERLDAVTAYSVAEKNFPFLTIKQFLPEALSSFITNNLESLPLIDSKGRLIGEVLVDSLLKTIPLGCEERLYAV